MKKGILLIGQRETGKSRIAKLLMDGKKQASFIGREPKIFDNRFFFSDCEKDTEVVYIDDLSNHKRQLEEFFNVITDGLTIDKKCKTPFKIHPQIIISIDCSISDLEITKSLERRFDIFELSACNTNYIPLTV